MLNYLSVILFPYISVECLLFQFIPVVSSLPDMSQNRPLRSSSSHQPLCRVLPSNHYPLKWRIQPVFPPSCSPAIRTVRTHLGHKDAVGDHVENVAKGSFSSFGKRLMRRVLLLGQFVRQLMETVQRNGNYSAGFQGFSFKK